jgi:hypothetical protein
MGIANMPPYFNELTVDLNDEAFFQSDIYGRTKHNPNPVLSENCFLLDGSLDEYADELSGKILEALEG